MKLLKTSAMLILALLSHPGLSMAKMIYQRQESSTISASSTSIGSTSTSQSSILSTTASASSTIVTTSATSTFSLNTEDPGDLVTSTFSGTIAPTATSIPGSDLATCQQDAANASGFFPFCRPLNGSEKTVGSTYDVTWYPGEFSNGTQITITLEPINSTDASIKFHSAPTDKNQGVIYLEIDGAWLNSGSQASYALWLLANNVAEDQQAQRKQGPTINIVPIPPTPPLPAPPPTSINTLGLAVGLPVSLAVMGLVIAVLYFGMRKTRHIGLGSVMGRRRGYGVHKSRKQRLGKRGNIGLGEEEAISSDSVFRDDPLENNMELGNGKYQDSTREDRSRNAGNVFREEIARQQNVR